MVPPNPGLQPELRLRIENTIRFLAVDAVQRANSGHPGAPMGLARAAFELWDAHLRFDPRDPSWPLRDRFVLSNGHASMLLYSLLHLYGFDLPIEQIQAFRQLHSMTPGHPEYGHTPGVELTTGPLGQGFAHGVGMALAGRATRARFGAPGDGPGNHFVYGIVSDGDLMEGISSEAGSLAGHLGIGNLIYVYDDNRITIDGGTELSFSENVRMRFEAQRWHVQEVDGEDYEGLSRALAAARGETERPSLVILRTVIGFGSPGVAGKSKAHGSPLGPDEVKRTKQALGWPLEPEFLVPDDVRAYFAERVKSKRAEREAADARLAAWRKAQPEKASAWDAARERRVPADLTDALLADMQGKDAATRQHGAVTMERLIERVPYLIGGSADLAGSEAPPILKGKGTVGEGTGDARFAGVNVHFGVREHAMAAITNGIALDGTLRPYCGTFLIFSDYMRPSLRLASLMQVPSIFVFTHDSIYLGEDGPTHQPIEQLDALRAIPGMHVFRPADGVETALCWSWIARHTQGPALLALTRQKLKGLARPASFRPEDVWKGGYAVRDPGASTQVVLVATGSEVSLACDAAEKLAAERVPARVVSLPSLELFLAQPAGYRHALVPESGPPVVVVEAGRGESLRRLAGTRGLVYGIDRFGASAPYTDLAQAFGFTPDQLCARVLEHLRERSEDAR
ncbi:MAG TPA: transketolase [Myxococcota bacterium]|jgi:transketolase|nr:transketolase [Myxococcota bacterium]